MNTQNRLMRRSALFASLACSTIALAEAPSVVSVRSEMRHDATSGSDLYKAIDLPLAGPRAIDPRRLRDGSTVLIFLFDQNPASVGTIETSHGIVNPISGIRSQFPNTVAVHLDEVPDAQFVTVTLRDIRSSADETLDEAKATVGYLMGDTTQNGIVNVSDIRKVGVSSGKDPDSGDNFILDTTINAAINVSDIRLTASRSGRRLTNTAPTIAGLEDQNTTPGVSTGALPFVIDDFTTPAENLVVTTSSSDTGLIPSDGIQVNGLGGNKTITVTPAAGQTGTATVTVTVSDGSLSNQQTFDVTASNNTPPIAFVAADNFLGAAPLTVSFDASASQDLEDNITQYTWNFDGSATGNGKKTSHNFTQPGTYEVELTVTDGNGQSDMITKVVTVSDGSFNVSTTPSKTDASRFLWQTTCGKPLLAPQKRRSTPYATWDTKAGSTVK